MEQGPLSDARAPELLQLAQVLSDEPLGTFMAAAFPQHDRLFPSDALMGDSLESQYRRWIERRLRPRLTQLGDEGARWWQVMTREDLLKHPHLFAQTLVVLAAWFLPDEQKFFSTVALLVAIRRLAGGDARAK